MRIADKIRILLILRGIKNEAAFARMLDCTPQNLSIKMRRDTFSQKDLLKIAEVLNCTVDITFTLNDTGEKV